MSSSQTSQKMAHHLFFLVTSTSSQRSHPIYYFYFRLFLSHLLLLHQLTKLATTLTTLTNIRSLSPSSLSSTVLSALPSADSFSLMHPNSATDTFLCTLSSSLDSLCPLTSRRVRKSSPAPWLSDSVRTERATIRAAERKWRKSKLPDDLLSYHSLLSTLTASISAAKQSFYQTKIQSSFSNPKKLFSIFSNLLDPPTPPPPSSLLPIHFVNYFTKKVDDIRSSFSTPPPDLTSLPTTNSAPSLSSFTPLSQDQVLSLITSARPTSCPLDPIPSHLLQSIASDLLPFLTHLINTSLSSGCFPDSLKEARVTPLLKKPTLDPSEVNNYRPVSLLPFLSKTLERAIFNQLSSYLHRNNLLDPLQSGFKAGHSTETALLAVTEQLHTARAASLSSVLILLDLSAAFDTVNHQILISSLQELGVSGSALTLLSSYLQNRTYRVTWRGSIHQLSWFCYSLSWFFLSQLCRRHPTHPLFSQLRHKCSRTDLRLSDRHLSVDV
ncbi:uncharacterized protein LOC131457848 [Solea solea]|uniref:uncharacterized protein LOC131457848 n=1 Tax=Solea solea TaxID=90069 RepID=UPI00272D8C2E|nr:uncharacterized protein LOC131457848 [Solea solea]